MANQQFQQPQRRRKDEGDAYSDDGGWSPGSGSSNGVSDDAQNTLDNIDDVLGQQEGLAGSPTQPAASPGESRFYNPKGDAAAKESSDSDGQKAAEAGGESAPWKVGADIGGAAAAAATPTRLAAKSFRVFFGSKQRSATTTIICVAVAAAAVFGVAISTGPAQAIEYGQILGLPGKPQQDATGSRLSRELRWARTKSVGETRLTSLESFANKRIQTEFAKRGITINTDKLTGQMKSVTIDLSKNPTYQGLSPEDAAKTFAADNNMSVSKVQKVSGLSAGKIGANLSDMDYTAQRGLLSTFVSEGSYGRVAYVSRVRILAKFYNANSWFRPISRLAAAGDKAVGARITAKAAQADEDSRLKALTEKTQAVKDFNASVRSKVGTKALTGVGGVLIATQAICVAKDVAHAVPEINRVNVVVPAVQSAGDALSVGSELMYDQPIDSNQVGAIMENFKGKDGSTPWQSAGIQHLENPNATGGTPIQPELGQAFSPDSNATNIENTLDSFGAAQMCSVIGKTVQGVAGGLLLLTGAGGVIEKGVQAGVSVALGVAIGQLTSHLEQALADQPLTGTPHQGANGGNVDGYAALEFASSAARQQGGVAMSAQDSQQLTEAQYNESKQQFASESVASRVFNTHDYRSAASKVIQAQNPNVVANMSDMFNKSLTSFTQLGSMFSQLANVFLPHASAASSTNGWYNLGYNIKQYGFTASELADPRFANPYDNAEAVAQQVGTPGSDTYNAYSDRMKQCFGDVLSQDSTGALTVAAAPNVDDPSTLGGPNPTSTDYQNANCGDKSTDWMRIRFFIMDTGTMEGYACYEGDDQSCQDLGLAADSTPTTSTGSFTVATYNLLNADSHQAASKSVGGCTTTQQDPVCAVYRAGLQAQFIKGQAGTPQIDIIATQETSPGQFTALTSELGSDYAAVPDNPTDISKMSQQQDGATSIIWNTGKFTKVGEGKYDNISNVANVANGGHVTAPYVVLNATGSTQNIYVTSIHYPNSQFGGDAATIKNASRMTMDWVNSVRAKDSNALILIGGDFNDSPGQKLSYCFYTADGLMQNIYDLQKNNSGQCPSAGQHTDGFGGIDNIYVSQKSGLSASGYTHVASKGIFQHASDHTPVYATLSDGSAAGSPDGSTIIPSACYTVTSQNLRQIEGKMLHWSSNIAINSYPKEDSPAGIKYAASHGYTSIDLDIRLTKDGVPVVTHWSKPFAATYGMPQPFYDPEGKLSQNATIEQMTFAEVSRLKSRDGQSQILSLYQMIQIAAQNKVNLSIEFKTNALIQTLPEIVGALNTANEKAYIKADAGRFEESLVAARKYGFWTRGTLGSEGDKAPDACHAGSS